MRQCEILFYLMVLGLFHSLIPPVKSTPGSESESDQTDFVDALFDPPSSPPKYLPESPSARSSAENSPKFSDGEANANKLPETISATLQAESSFTKEKSSSKRKIIDRTDSTNRTSKEPIPVNTLPVAIDSQSVTDKLLASSIAASKAEDSRKRPFTDDSYVTGKASKKSSILGVPPSPSFLGPSVLHSASSQGHANTNHGDGENRDRGNRIIPRPHQLLKNFWNNRLSRFGNMVEFARDQNGSRFIQQKLKRTNSQERQFIFDEIIQNALSLMFDINGSHVILKFFEFGTVEQKHRLMQAIYGNLVNLALHRYGCRVIQKALESLDKDDLLRIVQELFGQLRKFAKDENGSFVLQKIIELNELQSIQFIIDEFTTGTPDTIYVLSIHLYGNRVIQSLIEHCNEEQKRPVLEQLYENFARLAMDQFGCYVIAHVIEHSIPEDRERFMQQLRGHVQKYAKHIFAFNVIEKCLKCGNKEQKNLLIDEVCVDIGSQNPPLSDMMKHPVANHVVLKMWDIADNTQKEKMKSAIKKHIPMLRNSIYAKHIIAKMDKYFEEVNLSAPFNTLD